MAIDNIKNIWPEWEIEKQIGDGSYGVVYKAVRRDHNVESYAAIKVISIPSKPSEVESLRSEGLAMDSAKTYFQEIVHDFVSEIQMMESLKGIQNIVSVEDYKVVDKDNEFGWNIYIRMELLTPFNTYIRDKTLSEKEIIKLGIDICTALNICGKRNIIHRDIKPENIFINDFGFFKIGDFGIARKLENVTGGLSQKGTINYMAPEVATSSDYDARVDIYSLGIVLYRLLNKNRFPFLDTEEQLLSPEARRIALERRIRGDVLPPPSDASPEMSDLILRACNVNPDHRFSSALEMKDALESVRDGYYKIMESDMDKTELASPMENHLNMNAEHMPAQSDKSKKLKDSAIDVNRNNLENYNKKLNKKKKRKPLKILIFLIIIIALAGGGIYFGPGLFKSYLGNAESENKVTANANSDETVESNEIETDDSSEEDVVASIIAEAEELAAADDYEGALAKIQTGLITHSESEELKSKTSEYLAAIDGVKKETVLSDAAEYAESGDYQAALSLLKGVLDTYGEDADYQNAYDIYNQQYLTKLKNDAVTDAEAQAQSGNYLEAAQIIRAAVSDIGEDEELKRKLGGYESSYADSIIAGVENCMEAQDFDEAEKIIDEAIKEFPDNQQLADEKAVLEKSRPKYLVQVCSPYEWNYYSEPDTITMSNETYSNCFTMQYDAYALYNLGGNYETMTFTLGHVDGTYMHRGIFNIYLDEQFVEKIEISSESLPKEYVISLDGAKQMKISKEYNSAKYGFGNVILY